MPADWRKRLADRCAAVASAGIGAVIFLVVVGLGLNGLLRTTDRLPPDGLVIVVVDRPSGGWYRSIDSRSWREFDEPPFADWMTRAEAEELGLKPFPDDVRDGLFGGNSGFVSELLTDRGILPQPRRWIVLRDGAPVWDNGAALSLRDRRRLGLE